MERSCILLDLILPFLSISFIIYLKYWFILLPCWQDHSTSRRWNLADLQGKTLAKVYFLLGNLGSPGPPYIFDRRSSGFLSHRHRYAVGIVSFSTRILTLWTCQQMQSSYSRKMYSPENRWNKSGYHGQRSWGKQQVFSSRCWGDDWYKTDF